MCPSLVPPCTSHECDDSTLRMLLTCLKKLKRAAVRFSAWKCAGANGFKIFISSAAAHQCAGLCSSTSAFGLSLVSQFILSPFSHGCVTHSMMFGIHWCKTVPLIAGCKSSFLDLGCLWRDCCEDIQWWIRQVIENLILLKISWKSHFILFLIWFNMHVWKVLSISSCICRVGSC